MNITAGILTNWENYGIEEKGISQATSDTLVQATDIINSLSALFFYQQHWVFSWRYWKVAQMLALYKQGKASPENSKWTKRVNCAIDLTMHAIMAGSQIARIFIVRYNGSWY